MNRTVKNKNERGKYQRFNGWKLRYLNQALIITNDSPHCHQIEGHNNKG